MSGLYITSADREHSRTFAFYRKKNHAHHRAIRIANSGFTEQVYVQAVFNWW